MTLLVVQPDEASSKDAYIYSLSPNTNFGNSNDLLVVGNPGGLYYSFLQFDLSALPVGSVINSAVLSLDYSGSNSYPVTLIVKRVTQSWVESTINYNNRPSVDATIIDSLVCHDGDQGDYIDFDVTSLVQDWVNGTFPNYGLRLEEATNIYSIFHGSNHANKPELTIDYLGLIAPDTPTSLTRVGEGIDVTPKFSADISDPNAIQQIKARFEIYEDDEITLVGTVDSLFRNGAGAVEAEYLVALPKGFYKVRAQAIDDTLLQSGYTGWLAFSVTSYVNKNLILSWDVIGRIEQDLILEWDILVDNQVDLILSWDIRSLVVTDLEVNWLVRTPWTEVTEVPSEWVEVNY